MKFLARIFCFHPSRLLVFLKFLARLHFPGFLEIRLESCDIALAYGKWAEVMLNHKLLPFQVPPFSLSTLFWSNKSPIEVGSTITKGWEKPEARGRLFLEWLPEMGREL